MMRRTYLIGVAGSAALMGIVAGGSWLAGRRTALEASETLARSTADDIRTVLSLRTQRDRALFEPQGDANLTKLVRTALKESNVPESAFVSLSPEGSGTPLGSATTTGPKYVLRRSSVRLRQLRLPEIGRILDRWRSSQPLYAVTSVDLTRVQGSRGGEGTGRANASQPAGKATIAGPSDESFDVTLVLTTYVIARENVPAANGRSPRKDGTT